MIFPKSCLATIINIKLTFFTKKVFNFHKLSPKVRIAQRIVFELLAHIRVMFLRFFVSPLVFFFHISQRKFNSPIRRKGRRPIIDFFF